MYIELLTQERFGLKVVIPDDECRDYGQDRTTTRYNLGIIGDLRLMAILRDILHLNGFLQMSPIILLCMRGFCASSFYGNENEKGRQYCREHERLYLVDACNIEITISLLSTRC